MLKVVRTVEVQGMRLGREGMRRFVMRVRHSRMVGGKKQRSR